jgi:tellurite resistance protein TerC
MLTIWVGFIALVIALLSLDLGVFHRKSHTIGVREALAWTGFWGALSLGFSVLVYFFYQHHWLGIGITVGHTMPGREAAMTFLTGYLLEFSLSVDNLFVIALIIAYFRVPATYQHRVLFWGILGALVMRGLMIGTGTWLINRISWMIYVFGALLIVTAVRMLSLGDEEIEPDRNPLVRFARRFYPVTPHFDGPKFFTRWEGRRAVTPLFLVILVIESTDLLFAIDSIPAILGITSDPFLVFTSNVFAIMGLRSLYFALAGMMDKFRYLKVSLVILLIFIGVKMLLSHFIHIRIPVSLGVIGGILGLGVVASLVASWAERVVLAAGEAGEPAHLGRAAWRHVRRLVVLVFGSTGVLIGAVMMIGPGPGIAGILFGLVILSTEFVWARRLLEKVKAQMRSVAAKAGLAAAPRTCARCGAELPEAAETADVACPACGRPAPRPGEG